MEKIENVRMFLKKKGLYDTLGILGESKNPMTKRQFYGELNKFSYYNSYFRVFDNLMKHELITIERIENKKHIKLTEKGISLYNKLTEIYNLINNKEG